MNLPPMSPGTNGYGLEPQYTAYQMRVYGEACAAAAREREHKNIAPGIETLGAEIKRLQAELAALIAQRADEPVAPIAMVKVYGCYDLAQIPLDVSGVFQIDGSTIGVYVNMPSGACAPFAPAEAVKLAADNFEWSSLYAAVSHMMASLGAYGSLRADEIVVEHVMDALHRLDAGQFVPGLTPRAAAPAAPAYVPPIDCESLIAACVPGGGVCDPQQVADNIRRHLNAWTTPAAPAYVPLSDDDIHAIYDKVARLEPYSGAVTRRNVARAIESLVVARMRGEK